MTTDTLSTRMAGPAIRAWHMAEILSAEHDVRLVSTAEHSDLSSTSFRVELRPKDGLVEVESWCEIFIFQGIVMYEHRFLRDSDKIMVVDIYDPMHLETLESAKDLGLQQRRNEVRNATLILNEQLIRGDFFLAASPRQRSFWLGHLAALGRVNVATYDDDPSMGSLVAVAPFGLSQTPPQHRRPAIKGVVPGIAEGDKLILWGGGVYNWFDPITLIKAIDQLRHKRPDVRLYFLGLKHPNPNVPTMRVASETVALSDQLGLTDQYVFFNQDWVPYGERESYLTEADIGVSTHIEHVETVFSFRTRILDYLWAGLPIVSTDGDFFADLIEREELGLTVPSGDVGALRDALLRLLDDDEFATACGRRSAAIAQRFTWAKVLDPVVEFCRAPRRAPDLIDPAFSDLMEFQGPPRPPSGVIDNLVILLHHLQDGGPKKVATKFVSRLHYTFGSRDRRSATTARQSR